MLLPVLPADGRLLFGARVVRLFAYGFLSVVLVLYLTSLGLSDSKAGLLLSLTLAGDMLVSLAITVTADRIGRRRMLIASAALMVLAGIVFACTNRFELLLFAAIVGVISPGGNEIGPFLSIEQAAISQIVEDRERTRVFAWYNLVGSFSTAIGALAGGFLSDSLQALRFSPLSSYRTVVMGYALLGALLLWTFVRLSPSVEVPSGDGWTGEGPRSWIGIHRSRSIILKLSAFFALDAFGGGFVLQSLVAYWFHKRFGVSPGILGAIFFGANILAGVSALAATWIAKHIGLINTMVFTHIPSNVLLILVPLMPSFPSAVAVLLLRFSISQMDVPTRQAYTVMVVAPDERSAASGITGVARSIGASISPAIAGLIIAVPALSSVPFFLAGGLKIVYDVLLYRSFRGSERRSHEA